VKTNGGNIIQVIKELPEPRDILPFIIDEIKFFADIGLRDRITGLAGYDPRWITKTLEKKKDQDHNTQQYQQAIQYFPGNEPEHGYWLSVAGSPATTV
jgi:hypothetical protein